jgi:hypothetical protein
MVPGPGHYNDYRDSRYPNISYTIGNLDRQSPMSKDRNPGPGAYSSPSKMQGVKYSFGGKGSSRNNFDQNPGPGHYSPNRTCLERRSPLGKIQPYSLSPRPRATPGPGQYDPNEILVRERSPKYRMGGARIERDLPEDVRNQPGPGHYDDKRGLIGGPDSLKYSMGDKRRDNLDNHFPGPGSYEPRDGLTR